MPFLLSTNTNGREAYSETEAGRFGQKPTRSFSSAPRRLASICQDVTWSMGLRKLCPGEKTFGTIFGIARLLAMLAFTFEEFGPERSRDKVRWDTNKSLSQAIRDHFTARPNLDPKLVLGTALTASNIDRVAPIGIVWTNNLVDHLNIIYSGRNVCISHHVTFLKRMGGGESPEWVLICDLRSRLILLLYPKHLRTEYLQTTL